MDKVIEALLKVVSAHVLITIAAGFGAFFAVHYWRGHRTYSDTARDQTFLTFIVIIIAVSVIWRLNSTKVAVQDGKTVALIIPYFRNDENDQFRTALGTQIERVLASIDRQLSVVYHDSYVADESSAADIAKRLNARVILHGATVIRNDKEVFCSFRISSFNPLLTKTHPMVALKASNDVLNDIAFTVAAQPSSKNEAPANPIFVRLDALEKKIAELETLRAAPMGVSGRKPVTYGKKRALLIGIDSYADPRIYPLRFPSKDALAISRLLAPLRFDDVVTVTNGEATLAKVHQALANVAARSASDDLFIFYFTGMAFAPEGEKEGPLKLMLYDSMVEKPSEPGMDIRQLAKLVAAIPCKHKLCVLDASGGTRGLEAISFDPARVDNANSPTFYFLAGCQDGEVGYETSDGGYFSVHFAAVLSEISRGKGLWLSDLFGETAKRMRSSAFGPVRQSPKLVALQGDGAIYIARD